jgi:hypothetical protein
VEIGRTAEARQLAEYAVSVAGKAVPPVLAAWLQAVSGEVAAIEGAGAASHRFFDLASGLLPADAADPAVPYVLLDEYHLARWRGTAAARLGDEAAIQELGFALTGMDPTFVRAKAQLHVELAHSLITAKHRDQALVHVGEANALALRVGSLRQRRRVRQLQLVLDQAA